MGKCINQFIDNYVAESLRIVERYRMPGFFDAAVDLILRTYEEGKRVHVSGIGKMHHTAGYCASLLSSLGYPCYLLDGTEATHGSAGQVAEGDTVICLSYYGSVAELNKAIVTLKNNGARILSLTGFNESWIAENSEVHLNVFIKHEGDSLNKPPRMSILSTMLCFQCLSVILQDKMNLSIERYTKWHPSGVIGNNDK